MHPRTFVRKDNTAASTISVLLFLAFVLLFGVAVSGLIMGTSQQASTAPEVLFNFDGDKKQLRITHARGGDFQADQVTIEGEATAFENGDSVRWANAPEGASGTIEQGDSIVLGVDADSSYKLTEGRLKIIWHDSDTGQSMVIDAYEVKRYDRRAAKERR